MKSKKLNPGVGDMEGFLISEMVDFLIRKGFYDATAQQLRKYEAQGLFKPLASKENKYRYYTPIIKDDVVLTYTLRLIGFPLRRTKAFLDLKRQILENPLFEDQEKEFDSNLIGYVRKLRRGISKDGAQYQRLKALVEKYLSACDEIREKLDKIRKVAEDGLQLVNNHRKSLEAELRD